MGVGRDTPMLGRTLSHYRIIEKLGEGYSEAPIARGLASSGGMVEVFSSPDGETWTLLLTSPQGISCMMSEGQAWMAVQPVLAGDIS